MEITVKMRKKYIAGARAERTRCPVCHGDDLTWGSVEWNGDSYGTARVRCGSCSAVWYEQYMVRDIVELNTDGVCERCANADDETGACPKCHDDYNEFTPEGKI